MLDRYLLSLRQKEYRQRLKQNLDNVLYWNNKFYMNQEPASQEQLDAWNSQPPITFNLDERKKQPQQLSLFDL